MRTKIAAVAPDAVDALKKLVEGVLVQGENAEGQFYYYKIPPNLQACTYLIDRVMGRVSNTADTELAEARAALARQQMQANVFAAQAQFMLAQARLKGIEIDLFPKQFVTEEEELERMQTLAGAVNRPLLMLTPEKAQEFGIPAEKLEELKVYLAKGQQDILDEVFGNAKPTETLEEDEEEEAEE
jgi:hypothetical protein